MPALCKKRSDHAHWRDYEIASAHHSSIEEEQWAKNRKIYTMQLDTIHHSSIEEEQWAKNRKIYTMQLDTMENGYYKAQRVANKKLT